MNDPFLTRDWADGHDRFTGDLGAVLDRAWRTVKTSLDRLHAYEFDAPWRHDAKQRHRKPRGPAAA